MELTSTMPAMVNRQSSRASSDGIHFSQGGSNYETDQLTMLDSALVSNGSDGVEFAASSKTPYIFISSSIIYGNTGIGVKTVSTPAQQYAFNNAYGANGTDRSGFNAGTGDVALTATPFNNAASSDFSLNAATGGGALLRSKGLASFLFGTGYADIGAIQHQDPKFFGLF